MHPDSPYWAPEKPCQGWSQPAARVGGLEEGLVEQEMGPRDRNMVSVLLPQLAAPAEAIMSVRQSSPPAPRPEVFPVLGLLGQRSLAHPHTSWERSRERRPAAACWILLRGCCILKTLPLRFHGPLVLHQSSRFLVPGFLLRPCQCREPGSACWDVIWAASAQTAGSTASFLPSVTSAFQPGRREVTLDPVCAHVQGLPT